VGTSPIRTIPQVEKSRLWQLLRFPIYRPLVRIGILGDRILANMDI
jgi:hypothetical protein